VTRTGLYKFIGFLLFKIRFTDGLQPPFPSDLSQKEKKGGAHSRLPPGGGSGTEVSLGPRRQRHLAIRLAALGEREGEGRRAAHDLPVCVCACVSNTYIAQVVF